MHDKHGRWLLVASILAMAGCATLDSPSRFEGRPLSEAMATLPKHYQESGNLADGQAYFFWDFQEEEKITVTTIHNQFNPSVPVSQHATLAFEDRLVMRNCWIRVVYDPRTELVTRFQVNRPRKAKCRLMTSYLDGSAFLPLW